MYFSLMVHYRQEYCFFSPVHESTSLETQGQIVGARESLNRRKNMAQKKSKERPEEPLGQCLTRHCPKTCFWHQSEARTAATVWNWLFWPFFTLISALFFRPFRLSLPLTICPWVSEDDERRDLNPLTALVVVFSPYGTLSCMERCIISFLDSFSLQFKPLS